MQAIWSPLLEAYEILRLFVSWLTFCGFLRLWVKNVLIFTSNGEILGPFYGPLRSRSLQEAGIWETLGWETLVAFLVAHELTVCNAAVFTNNACKVISLITYIWSPRLEIAFSKTAFISLAFNIIQPERTIPRAERVTTWRGNGSWVAKLSAYHVTHIDSQVSITKRAPGSVVIYFYSASVWSWAIS